MKRQSPQSCWERYSSESFEGSVLARGKLGPRP